MKIRQLFFLLVIATCCKIPPEKSYPQNVAVVMDQVVSRLYREVPEEAYKDIDDAFMLQFLSPSEKEVLATKFQYFTVNVPVVVSLMRHQDQQTIPFWMEEAGFTKTENVVKNESYTYDVWEKRFPSGKIELGINGFDKHRPVYFVCVAPQDNKDQLRITDRYPADHTVITMEPGAFTYHDWSDLKLTEMPQSLKGQQLITTVRGRAREAHVIDAFRSTPYPSSPHPDQVMLTWSDSPKTTADIQWRTDTTVNDGVACVWLKDGSDTLKTTATKLEMQDRMLLNDRYTFRHTAQLKHLQPGTEYFYKVGSSIRNVWSDVASFKTEPKIDHPFSFIWFGDTHCFPDSGKLITRANNGHPDASFYSIAGDIVSTGLNRDDWDKFFQSAGSSFALKPLMPVPGNHDRQDGLGAKMYYDLFSLPKNAPPGVEPESSYSFEYGNALFLMIDATSDVEDHTTWIEEKLKNTKATWKFAMFHFPPYNFEDPYPEIQKAWVPVFDKYHVDMVMGGHVHYYMRSNPMFNGKVVDSFKRGTVYAISISIPSKHDTISPEPYAVVQYPEGYYYQHMNINGHILKYTAYDHKGAIKDQFQIVK